MIKCFLRCYFFSLQNNLFIPLWSFFSNRQRFLHPSQLLCQEYNILFKDNFIYFKEDFMLHLGISMVQDWMIFNLSLFHYIFDFDKILPLHKMLYCIVLDYYCIALDYCIEFDYYCIVLDYCMGFDCCIWFDYYCMGFDNFIQVGQFVIYLFLKVIVEIGLGVVRIFQLNNFRLFLCD